MNQTFDMNRWWLLVGKHWSENRKKYVLSLVAMAGLLLVWYLFGIIGQRENMAHIDMQASTYFFGLYLVGCFYASTLFGELGSKTKGLNYLVVPASILEKLLCALFYGLVVFFVFYTVIYYVLDMAMVSTVNSIEYRHWLKNHATGSTFVPDPVINIFSMPATRQDQPNVFVYLILGYLVLQAAFTLGSVYFARFSFIKTFISLLLICLVIAFLFDKVIFRMLPPGSFYNGVTSYHLYTVKDNLETGGTMIYSDAAADKLVTLPRWIDDLLLFIAKFAFAPILWIATLFRLKEKEI